MIHGKPKIASCKIANLSESLHIPGLINLVRWPTMQRRMIEFSCERRFVLFRKRKPKARPWSSLILLNLSFKREYQQWIKRSVDRHKTKQRNEATLIDAKIKNCLKIARRAENWQRTKFLISSLAACYFASLDHAILKCKFKGNFWEFGGIFTNGGWFLTKNSSGNSMVSRKVQEFPWLSLSLTALI